MPSAEQTKEVLTALRQLSEREQEIIQSFSLRFGFLNAHNKAVIDIVNKSRQYRHAPSQETISALTIATRQLAEQIKSIAGTLVQSEQEEDVSTTEISISQKEKSIFEEDITTAIALEQEHVPDSVRKKIDQYILTLQKALGDTKQQQTISEHLQSITRLFSQNIAEQKQLYTREITLLESYTAQSEYITGYETELEHIMQRIETLTLQERQNIINPINILLEKKNDITTLFTKRIEGKDKITLEDVKDILRTMTRTSEEVLRVQSLLIKNAHLLDTTPLPRHGNKTCLDIISRYGLAALTITERKKEEVQQQSTLDGLTGTLSKTYFQEISKQKIVEASRQSQPLSLLIIDGDKFKHINDSYGHHAGDLVIQFIASTIRRTIKSQDIVGRFGGDEFVTLFPNTTLEQTFGAAQRIRTAVQQSSPAFLQRVKIPEQNITITGGIATFHSIRSTTLQESTLIFNELFRKADQALIDGKKKGRNEMYKDEKTLHE